MQQLASPLKPKGFKKFVIVATVISATMLELIDTTIVNVALSNISGNLGATIEDASWIVTAYAIANVIVIPMTGFLASYFGRKNYYLTSIIIFTFASFMCGNSTNLWELVAWRFIQGIGGGALLSTSQSILFDTYETSERPTASAIFGMGVIIGPTVGPTLGGYIVDSYHWSYIFDINIPVGILAAFLVYSFIDKQPYEYKIDRKKIKIDYIGIALLCLWVGSLQYILEKGQSEDWFQAKHIVVLTVVAVISFVGFVWWELKTDAPAVNLKVLKNRTLAITTVLTFIMGMGIYCSMFVYPVWMQQIMGFTPTLTGESLLPGAVVAAFMMPLVARAIMKGVAPKYLITCGFTIFAFFCFWMASASSEAGAEFFFIPLLLRGVGMAMLSVPLTNQAVSGLQPMEMPQGIAINNMLRQLGGSFGIAFMNTYVATQYATHRIQMLQYANSDNPIAVNQLNQTAQSMIAKGVQPSAAHDVALKVMDGIVTKQAYVLTYLDAFRIVGIFFICVLPLMFFVKKRNLSKDAMKEASEHAH
ncbi:DHA2 family multidrug resistance protein [Chitinophaga skermanii]|uniref:DHA2 family multidrug resistance protein n=1 Tax=Chitinophaga skermanii TaxID=331697 RepID=A0A327R5L1_9BACT|nr:MDR family MFS transporter [Chitinophaga skermanii]RAJ10984.1 DHA2 family multidrug resistance protein [Chitinophaga skermanii]